MQQVEAEVWVIDNASTDGSIEYLQPRFPWVNFIKNVNNAGFAKANNQALLLCSGKYVLFLNPDTLLPEDCLKKCISFIESNSDTGAIGIRMIDGSGTFLPESKRSFPTPLTSFYKLTGLSGLFPKSKIFGRYALAYLDEFKNHEADVLAGAFMMAKKELLLQLKGFDETFFMYGEDIDLSYRIQKSGYKNYYFSESTIIHFKGESTSKESLNYVKMFYKAMSIFVKKHYTGSSARLFASFIQFAIWLRAGISAIARGVTGLGKLFSGYSFSGNQDETKKHRQTLIVGSNDEYNEVKNLLVNAGLKERIVGRLATNSQKEDALGTLQELNTLIETKQLKEVIFCQGSLSFADIIEIIQTLPQKVSVRFHAKGTQSIAGSDSKNTSGEIVAAKRGDPNKEEPQTPKGAFREVKKS